MVKEYNEETIKALVGYPYFILNKEMKNGINTVRNELLEIQSYYVSYKKGSTFYTEGTQGDYTPSTLRFKKAKKLIDKESRFMFSQTPDVIVQTDYTDEQHKAMIQNYQKLLDSVLNDGANNFGRRLLQASKDCFIGKRVAVVVDCNEDNKIQTHFYNSLQFYYETEYDSDKLTKIVTFENVSESKNTSDRIFLVNRYEEQNNNIYFSSNIYDGGGNVLEELVPNTILQLDYIPAIVIFNDGVLGDKRGTSEIESLTELESGYSRLSNADVDSERKGMNPIRYTVDMNPSSTKDLPSGAGAYWDLHSDQNVNISNAQVGTLSPALNHTDAVKETLQRIEQAMHDEVDVPNITSETMVGTITSGKALKILYYPLEVRCNEKLKVWIPAIKFIAKTIIDMALLSPSDFIASYVLTGLQEITYNIEVYVNYALMDDEETEKASDLQEIVANARSRKSYIAKWRKEEFKNENQIQEELMQIAIENNMFDSMSMNTQISNRIDDMNTQIQIDKNIEDVKING